MSSGAGGMIAWGGCSCLLRDKWCVRTRAAPLGTRRCSIRPSCQESCAPTVARVIQIGLHDPAEADLEHFWNCCSAGFLGERLYFGACCVGCADRKWKILSFANDAQHSSHDPSSHSCIMRVSMLWCRRAVVSPPAVTSPVVSLTAV